MRFSSPLASHYSSTNIQAEMVAVLFRQSTPVFFGNYAVSILFAWMLWYRVDQTVLVCWVAAIFLLTTIRLLFARHYWRSAQQPRYALRWAWQFAALSGLSGMLWGAVALLFLLPGQPFTIVLVGFVLAGMLGGSVASLSAFIPAYYAYAIPAVAPFIIRAFMLGGELFSLLGVLAICLLGVNLYYSRVIWQTLNTSVKLRFENLVLIEQLQQEKDRAESASQAKTHFLAAASHDLRQPVHALGLFAGSLHLLAQQAQPNREMLANIAERIQASLRNLGVLLNSLLNISRLESGTVVVGLKPHPVQQSFEELENEFGATARNKGLQLHFCPTRLWVEADPAILSRILSNLVENAIRYTLHGGIVVGCRRLGDGVAIQVWDTGIGIAEDQIPHIFREFYQVGNVARDQEQGLGLGLSIVKRSADIMGVSIMVRSELGKGSLFSLVLPRVVAAQYVTHTAPENTSANMPGLTILLIDDHQDLLDAASTLIAAWGHSVIAARDVAEAVAKVKQTEQGVDLILADYRLKDGVKGTDAIAAVNASQSRPVAAAIVTGDTAPERIQEAASSGFKILHKPLSPQVLSELIEETCSQLNERMNRA